MKSIQVRMIRNVGTLESGSTHFLRPEDAFNLIIAGQAVELSPKIHQPEEPTPVEPMETKPFGPSEVKAEEISKKKLRKRSS